MGKGGGRQAKAQLIREGPVPAEVVEDGGILVRVDDNDNEWGFSNRMVEVAAYFGALA